MKQDFFMDSPPFPLYDGKNTWPWLPLSSLSRSVASSDQPRISIVTPSYNQGQFIEETIRSVLLQGYPNLEYIIIDGGSTDNTIDIIRKYEPWITSWISEPDRGQSHAINKGLQRATGEWVAWLNADDIYMPGAIFTVAKTISQAVTPSWVVGTTIVCDQKLTEIDRFKPNLHTAQLGTPANAALSWIDFVCTKRSGIALPQPSSFWRREAVEKAGSIDESLKYVMDHELYGRLAFHGFRPVLLDEPLACFRTHKEQKTTDFPVKFWMEELDIVRSWEKKLAGTESRLMKEYGNWLERRIKYYPLRLVREKVRSQYRYLRNSLLNKT